MAPILWVNGVALELVGGAAENQSPVQQKNNGRITACLFILRYAQTPFVAIIRPISKIAANSKSLTSPIIE